MPKTEYFLDAAGEWRWHRKADNGEIIATSGEGYKNKADAMEIGRLNFPDDEIYVERERPPSMIHPEVEPEPDG